MQIARVACAISSAIMVSSCGWKLTKVCNRDVGSTPGCCAIGTQSVDGSEFYDQDYSCRNSQKECQESVTQAYPASKFKFTPTDAYKHNQNFNAGCAATEWKQKDLFEFVSSAIPAVTTSFRMDEQVDCRVECNYDFPNEKATGSVQSCPQLTLNADIPGALFLFYSMIDPKSYPDETNVVPIENISRQFGIPSQQLTECKRSDVFVERSGSVNNIGGECRSIVDFGTEFGEERSELTLPVQLSAYVSQSDSRIRWTEYSSPNSAFKFAHANKIYDKFYGGYVPRSGMLYDVAIAEIINRDSEKKCVRAKADLSANNSDTAVMASSETFLSEAMKRLLQAIASRLEEYKAEEKEARPYPAIAATTAQLSKGEMDVLVKGITEAGNGQITSDQVISISHWMDASLCNKMIDTDGRFNNDYIRAYQQKYLSTTFGDARVAAFENLLRCAYSPAYISPAFENAVTSVVEK
ncbi:hypothetical protein [Mesorhizobium sp.]|uniref:hypothetical protein n=1 Tax=Mesorhizobium sp. TaxID=1871066 RepID=UPI000FE91755|nr:hypothetical protein [Mesorhizobium sp.]RWQ57835.1 MAG: hypothetical protein EOS84_04680 [Mesorhizobium sp.]